MRALTQQQKDELVDILFGMVEDKQSQLAFLERMGDPRINTHGDCDFYSDGIPKAMDELEALRTIIRRIPDL